MNEDKTYPDRAHISMDKSAHIESGWTPEDDPRKYANQLFLSQLFPDFIPNIISTPSEVVLQQIKDEERGFPVEAIKGKNWHELVNAGQTSLERHCEIGRTIISQVEQVWLKTGILCMDLNLSNAVIADGNGPDKDGRIYLVDIDSLYDVWAPYAGVIIADKPLEERQQELSLQKKFYDDKIILTLLNEIIGMLKTLLKALQYQAKPSSIEAQNVQSMAIKLFTAERHLRQKFSQKTLTSEEVFAVTRDILVL